ncbi:MAG TPA: hypothetical protein VFF73_03380 [Planctomycetota bacterium]|nr:hypothetical protein [Planctomycetota bacterium]
MRALWALLVVSLLGATGCTTPEPRGTSAESAHYEIRTDQGSARFSRSVAQAAEQAHAALKRLYGDEPVSSFPVVVYTDQRAFEEQLAPALRAKGFVGECEDHYALVLWRDDDKGKDTLAHELVHHFNAELLPDIPYWLDEGLAKALAPKRTAGDWLEAVATLREDELRARLRTLDSLPEGEDYSVRCLVAAAVVRFALETGDLADVRALEKWKLRPDDFLKWLRGRRGNLSKRFQPVWAAGS